MKRPLVHQARRWSQHRIALATAALSDNAGALEAAAEATGRLRRECDRAMWAGVGRSASMAAYVANAGAGAFEPPLSDRQRELNDWEHYRVTKRDRLAQEASR